ARAALPYSEAGLIRSVLEEIPEAALERPSPRILAAKIHVAGAVCSDRYVAPQVADRAAVRRLFQPVQAGDELRVCLTLHVFGILLVPSLTAAAGALQRYAHLSADDPLDNGVGVLLQQPRQLALLL